MRVAEAITYALLVVGVGLEVVATLGVMVMTRVYDRLHYLGPASLGAVLIAAALWVAEGSSFISLKATLLAAFLLIASPTLTHVTARATRISELGDWRPTTDERAEPRQR
ncbi:MAG TPA: monovalent cation/H(+) antiporter subunit G [Solirubrobacterales bacterium]|nr:monovalent cation/H(+) antiporter subunit G [Solirubrobacterales bacterium]